jgi:hypothetical protein
MYRMSAMGSKSGLTLVETIVSLALFALFIGGVCGLLNLVRELSDNARDHYMAANLAKNRIERAKEFGYENVPLFVESNVRLDEEGEPDTDGRFRRTTAVTMPSPNLYQLVVTVDILDRRSLSFDGEQETVETYITDMVSVSEVDE